MELLARAGPVDHGAVLNEHDVGRPPEVAALTFGRRTEETQQRLKLPCAMARLESTPARPIVSRSCSAAGQSAASTVECTGMRKDAPASRQFASFLSRRISRAGLEETKTCTSSTRLRTCSSQPLFGAPALT